MNFERECRICGCTDLNACVDVDGEPCAWMDEDLCSACADLMGPQAILDIAEERARQIRQEGFTAEHDDRHANGDLASAAACYCMAAAGYHHDGQDFGDPPAYWPWAVSWWKPRDPRRDLVRAAALISAEIERLDRESAQR